MSPQQATHRKPMCEQSSASTSTILLDNLRTTVGLHHCVVLLQGKSSQSCSAKASSCCDGGHHPTSLRPLPHPHQRYQGIIAVALLAMTAAAQRMLCHTTYNTTHHCLPKNAITRHVLCVCPQLQEDQQQGLLQLQPRGQLHHNYLQQLMGTTRIASHAIC